MEQDMNNQTLESVKREVMSNLSPDVYDYSILGIKIVGIDRNIFSGVTTFVFENGWEIPVDTRWDCSPEEIVLFLTNKIRMRLGEIDISKSEAFSSPEVLEDEDPDELDSCPLFVCENCMREVYNVRF